MPNYHEKSCILLLFLLFRLSLKSRILQWIIAQISRILTVLAFDSPFPFGAEFGTFCLQLLICLSINRSAAQNIDFSSHPVFKNWFSSILVPSFHSCPPEIYSFSHWHLSKAACVCPFVYFINPASNPIIMTLLVIFTD